MALLCLSSAQDTWANVLGWNISHTALKVCLPWRWHPSWWALLCMSEWCTVYRSKSWAPNARNYICGCFNTSPEVVGPEASSHRGVRKDVNGLNLSKYFNIFIDVQGHVKWCPLLHLSLFLHLLSLEKLRGASINGFGCFPLMFSPPLSTELTKSRSLVRVGVASISVPWHLVNTLGLLLRSR